jgi:hypothetical protein
MATQLNAELADITLADGLDKTAAKLGNLKQAKFPAVYLRACRVSAPVLCGARAWQARTDGGG